jgi:hypothetical protein
MQNHTIRMRNERRTEMYQAKLDMVRDQIANNAEAAQASYAAEQYRLNDIYDQSAFKQSDMLKRMTEAMGTSAAREVYGKKCSARSSCVCNGCLRAFTCSTGCPTNQ